MRLVSSTVFPIAFLAFLAVAAADEWQLASDKGGVRMSTRPVAGSPVNEVRGEMDFDVPAAAIYATLADVESYPRFIPYTLAATRLKSDGPDSAWFHMVINPPLIFRRDYCIRTQKTRLQGGAFKNEWRVDETHCPKGGSSIVRMKTNSGSWTMTPLPGGLRTHVVYQSHADPGGDIPTWIVNRVTTDEIPGILKAVQKASADSRYQKK